MNTPRACRFVVNLWNIFAATVAPPLSRELADPQALIGHRPCRACDALLVHGPLIFTHAPYSTDRRTGTLRPVRDLGGTFWFRIAGKRMVQGTWEICCTLLQVPVGYLAAALRSCCSVLHHQHAEWG